MKISILTLKSIVYGAGLLNDSNLHNRFLMVELEAKIPMFVYSQRCGEKTQIQIAGGTTNIETITEFYERIVELNNDPVYTRARFDDMSIKPREEKDKDKGKRGYEDRTAHGLATDGQQEPGANTNERSTNKRRGGGGG